MYLNSLDAPIEFAALWKKTKSRSDAHIQLSTKEDVGVSKTLQEVLITGTMQIALNCFFVFFSFFCNTGSPNTITLTFHLTGLKVDIDGEVFEKDILAERNMILGVEKKLQQKEMEEKIETLEDKVVRVNKASEEQLEALEDMNTDSIEYFKKSIADQKAAFEQERKDMLLKMQVGSALSLANLLLCCLCIFLTLMVR